MKSSDTKTTLQVEAHGQATADTDQTESATQTPETGSFVRAWWILAVLGIAQLMIVVDTTIVATALPDAQADLRFSDADRQWVVSAYALAFGSLLLVGGKLTDRIGRRRAFILSLIGFALASGVAGAAPTIAVLIWARAGQGVFAAILAPAVLSTLTTVFGDRRDRARAFGVFGAIGGGGAALGLLLGGVLTDAAGWRWTMYVNIGFALLAVIGAAIFLPRLSASARQHIDLTSAAIICAGLFAVVAGVSRLETGGWSDPLTMTALAGGMTLILVFVLLQRRRTHPLLPFRVIADRDRAGGLLALFTGVAGMLATFLLMTYFLQSSLGYTAIQCGLAFLPLSGSVIVVAAASGALNARVSPRILLPGGLLLGAVALLLLTRLTATVRYAADVLPAMVLLGAGLGLVYGVAIELGTRGLLPDDTGIGSAVVNSVQQIGGSLGAAVFSTVATTAATAALARGLPADAANLHGSTTAFAFGSALFAVGAAATFALIRSRRNPGLDRSSAATAGSAAPDRR